MSDNVLEKIKEGWDKIFWWAWIPKIFESPEAHELKTVIIALFAFIGKAFRLVAALWTKYIVMRWQRPNDWLQVVEASAEFAALKNLVVENSPSIKRYFELQAALWEKYILTNLEKE